MKYILTILLLVPFIGIGQLTYVPDDWFEQKLIDLGYDNVMDDYVQTSNISGVTSLNLVVENFNETPTTDLTGIEDFISLTYLGISGVFHPPYVNINLSQMEDLTEFYIWGRHDNLVFSNNLLLEKVTIRINSETPEPPFYDFSNNLLLRELNMESVDVSGINISQNINLEKIDLININSDSPNSIIDFSSNINVEFFRFSPSGYFGEPAYIGSYDFSHMNNLEYLYISDRVSNIDVSENYLLKEFYLNLVKGYETLCLDLSNLGILDEIYVGCSFDGDETDNDNLAPISVNIGDTYVDEGYFSLHVDYLDSLGNYSVISPDFCLKVNYSQGQGDIYTDTDYDWDNTDVDFSNWCIETDDINEASNTFTDDGQALPSNIFTNECISCDFVCTSSSGLNELSNTSKNLIKIVDMMGRETSFKPNTPLIYVYDDGSTEKVFTIE